MIERAGIKGLMIGWADVIDQSATYSTITTTTTFDQLLHACTWTDTNLDRPVIKTLLRVIRRLWGKWEGFNILQHRRNIDTNQIERHSKISQSKNVVWNKSMNISTMSLESVHCILLYISTAIMSIVNKHMHMRLWFDWGMGVANKTILTYWLHRTACL